MNKAKIDLQKVKAVSVLFVVFLRVKYHPAPIKMSCDLFSEHLMRVT